MKTTLHVEQIEGEISRFFVESSSRPGMKHVVDFDYRESPRDKPTVKCGCESNFINGRLCPHIEAVVAYLKD